MPAFITSFVATFIAWLADAAGTIAGRALVQLGIGAVTVTGINLAINLVASRLLNIPPDIQAAIGAVGVDWFISMIPSAIATRASITALQSNAITFWTMRGKLGV